MSITPQGLLREDLKIKTALVTVFDKTDIVDFARELVKFDVRLVTTGGTFNALNAAGIPVTPLGDVAPFPEMLDGRVKTLQPQIFGGVLANKAVEEHLKEVGKHGLTLFDMVVCNFYPFERVAARKDATLEEKHEYIDIGGPAIIRAGAKNVGSVCVVPGPNEYPWVIQEMRRNEGRISFDTRHRLSVSAFKLVAEYDNAVAKALESGYDRDAKSARKAKALA